MARKKRPQGHDLDPHVDYDPNPIDLDDEDDAAKRAQKKLDEDPLLPSERAERLGGVRTFTSGSEDGEIIEIAVDTEKQWYVIHCYSGYENKVMHAIRQRTETMGMHDKIFDVVVPTEEELEVHEGKRKVVERRVFPGYILVQMKMDEDSWYVVRNTPGVTGFVGMGNEPTPLRPEEVNQIMRRMEHPAPTIKPTFKPGQKVRITDGPFNDFVGTVGDIDMEKSKVRVMVSFFGRETPVELDFLQVEKA
ncbi:MAG: transcription termination/antitermination protein NusG [Anaerolineae bacterium]|nr:transcription termination/antitermination protein NusG [Anaerolineae bacterium]